MHESGPPVTCQCHRSQNLFAGIESFRSLVDQTTLVVFVLKDLLLRSLVVLPRASELRQPHRHR